MCRDLKDPSCEIINMLDQIPHVIVERCYFQNIWKKSQFNHKLKEYGNILISVLSKSLQQDNYLSQGINGILSDYNESNV